MTVDAKTLSAEDARASRFEWVGRILGRLVAALGVIVLAGWWLDVPTLRSIRPDLASMKPNTALSFVALGFALALPKTIAVSSAGRRARSLCAALVVLVASLTLAEYVMGFSLGIDEVLARDPAGGVASGRMAPGTAWGLILLGAGLSSLDRSPRVMLGATLMAWLLAFLVTCGYLFDAHALYRIGPFVSIALHTAVGMLMAATGLMCAAVGDPRSFLRVLASETLAGRLIRTLVPLVAFVPVAVGWIRLRGQAAGLYDTNFGVAILVVANVGLLAAVTWFVAVRLDTSERARLDGVLEAANRNALAAQQLERNRFFDISVDFVCIASTDGYLKQLNPTFEQVLGFSADELRSRPFVEFVHPEDVASTLAEVEKLANGAASVGFVNRYRCRDGSYRWLEWRTAPDNDGMLYAVARDTTEQRAAHAALEASVREKEVLLQEVHHRVKNNLQVISSMINMQMRRLPVGAERIPLEECRARVQAIALIHEQLYQARDYGNLPFSEYAKTLIKNVWTTSNASDRARLSTQLSEVNLSVDRAIPCGLVLNELMSNALKHGVKDSSSGEVRVELRSVEGRVRLTVSDDGEGLPPDFDIRRSERMGLRLVRSLAEQLRGTITASTAAGARFELDFPARE